MAKAELSLHERHSWKGQWWPVGTNSKLVGDLVFSPYDWINLEVLGLWPMGAQGEVPGRPNILGYTKDGKAVTRRHPIAGMASLSAPGMATSSGRTNLAFIGGHYEGEPTYVMVKACFSNLDEWLGATGIGVKMTPTGTPYATITLGEAPKTLVRVEEIGTTIEFGADGWIDPQRFHASTRSSAFVRLKPDEPKPWSWFWTQLVRLRYFLALTTDLEVTSVWVRGARSSEEVEPGKFKTEYDEVLNTYDKHLPPKDTPSNFMLASRAHLGESLAPMLSKWMANYDSVAPLSDLLFGYRYSDRMFVEFQLLALTQGLEGFHRLVKGGRYLTKEEWEPHRQVLNQAIPPTLTDGHKSSLRNKIKFAYEYSLRKRLTELMASLGPDERSRVSGLPDQFIERIVLARNAATHLGSTDTEEVDWEIAADWVSRLDTLAVCLLLRWMGMEETAIVQCLGRPSRFPPIANGAL